MQRKFRVDYDPENDSLFLYRERSHGSVELGNLILDFDSRKDLVGLELLDASNVLQGLNTAGFKLTKQQLSSVKECRVDTRITGGFLMIRILLFFSDERQLAAAFSVPSIKEPSPLAATA